MDISIKDDVAVFLLLGLSFMGGRIEDTSNGKLWKGGEGKDDINDNLGKRIKLKEGGRVNDDLWRRKCTILLNVHMYVQEFHLRRDGV